MVTPASGRWRRRALALLLAGLPVPALANGACDGLAGATVQWVVPTRPGGGYDAYSRLIEPFLERALDAQVLVVNRPEAGGVVAARAVMDASPDGRTLAILNATGLLTAHALGDGEVPHPGNDFTVLGRLAANHVVLFTSPGPGLDTLEQLLSTAQSRPIVFGVRDVGSTSFLAPPVVASLLGVEHALVTGYLGSSARVLAVMRGEVDAMVANHDSVSAQVRDGELIPVLQLTPESGDLLDVPRLDGPGGVAERRAGVTSRSAAEALALAGALGEVVGAGRVIVAPPGMAAAERACLGQVMDHIAADPGFQAAVRTAGLTVEWLSAPEAVAAVESASRAVEVLAPVVRPALEEVLR